MICQDEAPVAHLGSIHMDEVAHATKRMEGLEQNFRPHEPK